MEKEVDQSIGKIPVKVVKTTPKHAGQVDYLITIPEDVDINEYTDRLAKDLTRFLRNEIQK